MAIDRGVSPALLKAIAEGRAFPVTLVDVEWSDGNHYYFHTGLGPLEWDGKTWLSLAGFQGEEFVQLGQIELPEENMTIAAADANLSIQAGLEALLATQAEYARGLEVVFYFGGVTEPAGTTLFEGADPKAAFTGITNGNSLGPAGSPGLGIIVTSGVPARASAAIVHSSEDQQSRYPLDTIFDAFAVAQKWSDRGLQWPE